MKKYKPLIIIFIVLVALGLIWALGQSTKKSNSENTPILFYGETCSHCKIVDQYLADNNVRARIKFQELEVFNNKANAALLAKKAKSCGLDTTQGLGVPFLFDGQNCLSGSEEIINFFKTK